MIRRILARITGEWCETHARNFQSDFCPECLRTNLARNERIDRSPAWTKSEWRWPLKRKESA
jgi:hypothetical protein